MLTSSRGTNWAQAVAEMESSPVARQPVAAVSVILVVGVVFYLLHINRLLSSTPDEVRRLTPQRWTREAVEEMYRRLEKRPITTDSYKDRLPPKLERRYIVTGGSGASVPISPGQTSR